MDPPPRRRVFPLDHRSLPHVAACRSTSQESRGLHHEVVLGSCWAGVSKAGAGIVGVWCAGEAVGLWIGELGRLFCTVAVSVACSMWDANAWDV
jgi:hypothetical protein